MVMKRDTSFQVLLFGSIFVVCIVLVTDTGTGRTITVDDDGNAEYLSIEDALKNATDGDTIRVWEGEYQGNIHITTSVRLIGNGSGTATVIRVEYRGGLTVAADRVTIRGLT